MAAIINNIQPKMKDGRHESFTNKMGKPMYVFTCTIEGEGDGEFYSTMPTAKWTNGMKISYEVSSESRAHGGKRFTKINEITAGGTTRSYNDPVNAKRMALSMAHTCANATVRNLEARGFEVPYSSIGDIFTIAHKYYHWITAAETVDDRDILSRKWYAVQYAVDAILCKKIFDDISVSTDKVLQIAQTVFDDVMKIQGKE